MRTVLFAAALLAVAGMAAPSFAGRPALAVTATTSVTPAIHAHNPPPPPPPPPPPHKKTSPGDSGCLNCGH